MARVLPWKLQIQKIEDRFCGLNICDELDLLDLPSVVDKTLSFRENISILKEEYPQYTWVKGDEPTARTYEKEIIADLQDRAGEFSYDVVKSYKVKDLERKAKKLGRTETALEECKTERVKPRKTPPGVCRVKTVSVDSHKRCWPRPRT